jgi:uncharacterized membrane protein YqaE (UPF0057 family)
MKKILLFSLVLAFLSSCSVDKRVYMSGYHVNWNKSKNDKKEVAQKEKASNIDVLENQIAESIVNEEPETISFDENISASTESTGNFVVNNSKKDVAKAFVSTKSVENEAKVTAPISLKEAIKINKTLKKELKEKNMKRSPNTETWVYVLLTLFIPFGSTISMYMYEGGWSKRVTTNLILTLLCGLPGVIHALVVILGNK